MSLEKENNFLFKVGIGQDSHRFLDEKSSKPCVIGGVLFEDVPGLCASSDGDVVFHSICRAISSISSVDILGEIAKELCQKDGITDSEVYLEKALKTLKEEIVHIAISIEGRRPYFHKKIYLMKKKIAKTLNIKISQIGITAHSGEGLTDFGCGQGIQCTCILTVKSLNIDG